MAAAAREVATACAAILATVATARPLPSENKLVRIERQPQEPGRRMILSRCDESALKNAQLSKLKALGKTLPGVVNAGVDELLSQLNAEQAKLKAEQTAAAEAREVQALSLKAADDSARAVLAVARWCVQTVTRAPACDAEVVTLRVNDERVALRCAFLAASPLMAAFNWRGREADSADPLVLRAPDGGEWWWNAETLIAAERALLDIELDWLKLSPDVHTTRDVLPMVKLYKLFFAFFPGDNEPVELIEQVLIAWLRAQKSFTSADVLEDNLALDAPLCLAIELLHADESRAVREAAATRVACAAPALLTLKDSTGSDAWAQECCHALSREGTATLKAVCAKSDSSSRVEGVLLLAKAAMSAGCDAVIEACLDALAKRYAEVMEDLAFYDGEDDAKPLPEAVRPHVAVLSKLFVDTRFDASKFEDPAHVLLVDAVTACAAELNFELPNFEDVKRGAVDLAASDLLSAVPLAARMAPDSWRAICAEAAAEEYGDKTLESIASVDDLGTLVDTFVFITGSGGLDVDDALPVAALEQLASCMGSSWSLSPELAERASQHLTLPALIRLLRATTELHAWPETFALAFNVLQNCSSAETSLDGTLAEDALGSLNLEVLTTTTWPLAVRQALDVQDANTGLASALRGHLRRLQEEEPVEQSAARAAWAEMSARLSS